MAHNKADYHPRWDVYQRWIRRRAKNCCEQCGIENDTLVRKVKKGVYVKATGCELVKFNMVRFGFKWKYWKSVKYAGLTRISCATCHLDRDRSNNQFSNLKFLCQRCHLIHDLPQHIPSRKFGREYTNNQQLTLFLTQSA